MLGIRVGLVGLGTKTLSKTKNLKSRVMIYKWQDRICNEIFGT